MATSINQPPLLRVFLLFQLLNFVLEKAMEDNSPKQKVKSDKNIKTRLIIMTVLKWLHVHQEIKD